jgi:hypothetical protein
VNHHLAWLARHVMWRSHHRHRLLLEAICEQQYITDGVELFEVLEVRANYGLAGGHYLMVVNCRTEVVRMMAPLEATLCSRVRH